MFDSWCTHLDANKTHSIVGSHSSSPGKSCPPQEEGDYTSKPQNVKGGYVLIGISPSFVDKPAQMSEAK